MKELAETAKHVILNPASTMPLSQTDHNCETSTEEFLDEAIVLRAMENDEYENTIQQFLLDQSSFPSTCNF